jgi:hypothetical protein
MKQIKDILERTAVYIQENGEGIRINYCDEEQFFGTGEESGEEYAISYDEVDLKTDMFYELKLIEI